MPTPRLLAGAGLVLLALLAALAALAVAESGSIDDAFVLLVYARHLAGGEGFVYNVGSAPVDGFTSFLDVLLKAGALVVFRGDPVRTNWLVTLGVHLAAVAVGALLVARLASPAGRRPAAALALVGALAVATEPGLAEGTRYQLGTPLLVLALVAAVAHAVLRRGGGRRAELEAAGLALALALARPEGAPLAAGILAWRAFQPGLAARRGRFLAPAAFALGFGAYLVWRTAHFGYWAPNSYYAKTSADRWNEVRDGVGYVWASGATWTGGVMLGSFVLAPCLLVFRGWRRPELRTRCALFAVLAWISLAVVVWSGGDCYDGTRFLAPTALVALLALVAAAAGLAGRERWLAAVPLAAIAGGALERTYPWTSFRAVVAEPWSEGVFAPERDMARRIADAVPGARVAQHDMQRFKYFCDDVEVLDTSGLNDARIAHRPEPGPVRFGKDGLDVAVAERFEVLHTDFQWSRGEPWSRYGLAAVLRDPGLWSRFNGGEPYTGALAAELIDGWRAASAQFPAVRGGRWFNFLVRADLADAFRDAGFSVDDR